MLRFHFPVLKCLIVQLGTNSGSGLDFINGFAFRKYLFALPFGLVLNRASEHKVQRFYSVFDTGNSQVGLAATSVTDATIN